MDLNYKWISDLLYNEDLSKLKSKINMIDDSIELHIIAYNYNWDDGFEIPNLIINNKNCDIGTALMIFDEAEGYDFFNQNKDEKSSISKEWFSFVSCLYNKLSKLEFYHRNILYTTDLTKVQLYKLKKSNPNIPEIFIMGTQGERYKVPIL
jgi:hypothetical protein